MTLIDQLQRNGIISDVLNNFKPSARVCVKFPKGEATKRKVFQKSETQKAPQVKLCDVENQSSYYSLFMVDPDAPSRENPIRGEYCHWVVLNATDVNALQSSGDEEIRYMGPAPPKGTGKHRYVFVVYGHDEVMEWQDDATDEDNRANFKLRNYAKKVGLGDPLAADWFECETV